MIQFKVSAPCKLSLFGEHAVKYEKRALAACIDLRTTLTFHELPLAPSKFFVINFPQVDLFYQVPMEIFLEFYGDCIRNLDSLRERVLRFADFSYQAESHRMIVQSFYYLLVLVVNKERIDVTSFSMHLTTDFMVDGKYVAAPSFMVCLAGCLLHWSRLQKGGHEAFFGETDLKTVQSYALRCQEITRGLELIDATICTYGSITEYMENDSSPCRPSLLAASIPVVTILLVDSKLTQNPETQSQQMAELMDILPETSMSIFNSIDLISRRAYNVFHQIREICLDDKLTDEWRRDCILKQYNIIKVSPVA